LSQPLPINSILDTRLVSRPRVSNRDCIGGILGGFAVVQDGKICLRGFPSYATCWRRFENWLSEGLWDIVLSQLLKDLCVGKKGRSSGETCRGKGTKIMFSPMVTAFSESTLNL